MLEQAFQLHEFYSLSELEVEWDVHPDTISRWLTGGSMMACVWLPLRSVYRLSAAHRELDHFEGFAKIGQDIFRRLMRQGSVELRKIEAVRENEVYSVPDSCDGVFIRREDCVIFAEEKLRFESKLQPVSQNSNPVFCKPSEPSFRCFQFQGETHVLGELQAAFLQHLYQAAKFGEPWQQGKQALGQIGSRSFRAADLFRHQPHWRDWIESDGRGGYRLRPEFLEQVLNR